MQGEVRISIKADIVPILTALNKTQKSIMNLQKRINKLAPEISDKLAKNFKDLGHSIEFSVKKMKELGKATKKVIPDMNLLGVGFFGMMIKRGFGMIMRAGTETFLTLAAGSRLVSENYGKFVALLNYSKFLLGSALMGTINGFLTFVNRALEKFNALSPSLKGLVSWTILLGFGIGTFMEKFYFAKLGLQSLAALKFSWLGKFVDMIKWVGEGTFLVNMKDMFSNFKTLAKLKLPSLIAFGKGVLKIATLLFIIYAVGKAIWKVFDDDEKKIYSWRRPLESFSSFLAEVMENLFIYINQIFVGIKIIVYGLEYMFSNLGDTMKNAFYDVLKGIVDKFALFVGLIAEVTGSDRMQKWADSLKQLSKSLEISKLTYKVDMEGYIARKFGVESIPEAFIVGTDWLAKAYAHQLKTNSYFVPFFDKLYLEDVLEKYGYYKPEKMYRSLSKSMLMFDLGYKKQMSYANPNGNFYKYAYYFSRDFKYRMPSNEELGLTKRYATPTGDTINNNVVVLNTQKGDTTTFEDYLNQIGVKGAAKDEILGYLYGSNNS